MRKHKIVGGDFFCGQFWSIAQKQGGDFGREDHQHYKDQGCDQGRIFNGGVDGFLHPIVFDSTIVIARDGQKPLSNPKNREQGKHQHPADNRVHRDHGLPAQIEQYIVHQ